MHHGDMGNASKVDLIADPTSKPGSLRFRFQSDLARGWTEVAIVVSKGSAASVRIFFDTGRGFNSEQVVDIGPIDYGRAERVIFFPMGVRQCRLEIECSPDFELRELSIQRLRRLAVTWRALRKNLWLALGQHSGRKPSVLIGLRLLFTGKFGVFFKQLRFNTNPECTAETNYRDWISKYEPRDKQRIHQIEKDIPPDAEFRFSIILCADGQSEEMLGQTIDSVLAQTHPSWELCIEADESLREYLAGRAVEEVRIRPEFHSGKQSRVVSLNSALSRAKGLFLALLDAGDQLAPHALWHLMNTFGPSRDFIYSDQDRLTPAGERIEPFFKPDWSPEYLLATHYTGRFAVYKTSLVRELGGFRSEYCGAEEYDLTLRLTAKTHEIAHVPAVLYHRGNSIQSSDDAERRAIEDFLKSQGKAATVVPGARPGLHDAQFEIVGLPLVSIIMASACRRVRVGDSGKEGFWALHSITSVRKTATYDNLEIILLTPKDINAELAQQLDAMNIIRQIYHEPFNFSAAMNQAAAVAKGEHLLLLNDDTEVISPDFIERMLGFSQQPEIGAVGAKLVFPNDTLQHAGVMIVQGIPWHPYYRSPQSIPGYHDSVQVHRNYVAVTAACMMTRREVFQRLNGFDPAFYMNYNDIDYCLRAGGVGYRIVYQGKAELYHYESMSKPAIHPDELRLFQERWSKIYARDPYYNPNFRQSDCGYVLPS